MTVKRNPSHWMLGSHWAGAYREEVGEAGAVFSWQLQPLVEDPPQAHLEQQACPLLACNGVIPREGFSS